MEERRFKIDPFEAQLSLEKAQKLVNRSQTKGLDGGYQVRIETTTVTNASGIDSQITELVLTGKPYKINGWTFVGVVEWLPNGAIVSLAPDFQGQDYGDQFVKQNVCEHCKINRYRKTQVIVVNEAGEFKIVGSTCTKDFLGWVFSPVFINDIAEEFEKSFGGGGDIWSVSTEKVLEIALAEINKNGYVKANNTESDKNSTKSEVENYLFNKNALSEESAYYDSVAQDILSGKYADEAVRILGEARELVKTDNSDYFRNLKVALTGDWTYARTIGLVVSVVAVIKRKELEDAKKKAEQDAQASLEADIVNDEQFAPTGNKVVIENAKVIDIHGFAGAYGYVRIYTFSGQGYRFKWFSTGQFEAEIGDVFTLKATVKGADDYNGKKSTLLTRVSDANAPKKTRVPVDANAEYAI